MKQINLNQSLSLTLDDIPSMKQTNKTLKASNQSEVYYLNSDLILYVEADGNYCNIHLTDGDILKTVGFQRAEIARMIESQLSSDVVCKFALVGKSFLVNIEHIMYINATRQQLIFDVNHADSCKKQTIKASVNALRNLREVLDEASNTLIAKVTHSIECKPKGFVNHISTSKPIIRNYDINEDEVMLLG